SLIVDDYNPLSAPRFTALFIKPSGVDTGNPIDNEFNSTPVSHEDLWKTIFDSEGITNFDESITGESAFNINPNRERHYCFYAWNLTQTKYTEYIYKIIGSGLEFNNWSYDKTKVKEINRNYYE
ncbi:MAG: hypothetical protein KBS91_01425, partial [Firmicutes bacterium]|nr:hypothetical protein [Candidatus Caballimonas caccae]